MQHVFCMNTASTPRIFLSPPHMSGRERSLVEEAFDSNYIAPVGPMLDRFEREFAATVGSAGALALSSGSAGLKLALRYCGVATGTYVFCSTLTFVASVAPAVQLGARPVFIDCDGASWCMDPELLAPALAEADRRGQLPKAVIAVDLYGQACDYDRLLAVCEPYKVPIIADSAEALGSYYKGEPVGRRALAAVYSFNGNKIITTSGGGMLVSNDRALLEKARYWSSQAREPVPYYQHVELGYNDRMSNVLAAIGVGQLACLEERVAAKRQIFEWYRELLGDVPGIAFMPEPEYSRGNRWLTVIQLDPRGTGVDPESIRRTLERHNIESRPVWKPMHLQPVFAGTRCHGGQVAERIYARGLCLPSGTALRREDVERVAGIVRTALGHNRH